MKKTYLIIGIIVFTLIASGIITYILINGSQGNLRNQEITEVVKNSTDEKKINELLSSDLLNKVKDSEAADKTFLKSGVSSYETTSVVKEVRVKESKEESASAEAVIETTTKNKNSGFEVKTQDTYRVLLKKEAESWKISEYTLLDSKEI